LKVGDLVRLKVSDQNLRLYDKVGVITDMSAPTPIFPFQVLTISFEGGIVDGISPRNVEVISECR